MKILIAEDDTLSRTLLTKHLEKWGHEVIATTDGQKAIDTFLADREIQFAVLDWMMPEIEGTEVCRRIKEKQAERFSYVIMLTAKVQKEDIINAFDSGADDFINKPFEANELRVRIRAGERIVDLHNQLHDKIDELSQALEQVQQLEGIIPICAWCKKIRDDSDYWNSVEDYIVAHSHAKFSHGICPDCLKEKYPDDEDEETPAENKTA